MIKLLNFKYILLFIGAIVAIGIIGRVSYEFSNVNSKIEAYYNDKTRPARNWYDWSVVKDNSVVEIVKTPSSILNPKYTVIYSGEPNQSFDPNGMNDSVNADVVRFKWNWDLTLVPDELIGSIYRLTKSYNEVKALAQKVDISEINKGKSEDDPTYDKSVTTFKNPSKEKIAARIEAAKLKPRFKIENPSRTDYIEYSRSDDLSKDQYVIKSQNFDPVEEGIWFNNIQRSIDGEQFTYWLNDYEFIYLVNKNNTYDKEWLAKVKDDKDGIYTFNTKTGERKLFIPIMEPDRDFEVDYEVLDDRITIYTSSGSKDYSKNTGKPF